MDAAAAYCCRYFQNENVEYILLSRSELDFAPYTFTKVDIKIDMVGQKIISLRGRVPFLLGPLE